MEMRSLVTVEGSRLSSSITKPVFRAASFFRDEGFVKFEGLEELESSEKDGVPPTPGIFYEYQKKGVRKLAFRKCVILKETVLERSKLKVP
jgi:hypothetical protein